MALAAKPEPIALPNKRDTFKISSSQAHPYILLNPEAPEKLYGAVQTVSHAMRVYER